MAKLPVSYYLHDDVVHLAKDLLGKTLFTNFNNQLTGGIITETEAYAGITDKASHAYGDRRTKRTEIMYHQGGKAYVYLCYGMYSLFNVVSNIEGTPHAILIRAIKPAIGRDVIESRLQKTLSSDKITQGPGKLTKALGIHYSHSGISLLGESIWIENNGIQLSEKQIQISTRIGIAYAQEDALLPYRFLALL
ncbi:MAG: DNA-3-methyladenine glycosylase [Bacteroidota bacterium]